MHERLHNFPPLLADMKVKYWPAGHFKGFVRALNAGRVMSGAGTEWLTFMLLQEGDRQLWGDDEDDDAGLDDSIVRDFHFGGGFIQKRRSTEDDGAGEQPAEAPKSKKEVGNSLLMSMITSACMVQLTHSEGVRWVF